AVIIFMAVMYEPFSLDGYEYPAWGQGIGWLVVCCCVVPMPLFFLINYCRAGGAKIMKEASQPTNEWGPALKKNRIGTVYERSGDRGRRTILAFTKSSGEPFEGKNGELSTSLMIMDESYRVYKPLAEKLNTDDGFANPGFDDQSMVSESTAF
ncbi:hypothetical protein LSH36_329g03009, partial [Paralvinella palmiformis]